MPVIYACDPSSDFSDGRGRGLDPSSENGVGGGPGLGPCVSHGEVTGCGVSVVVVECPIEFAALSAGRLLLWCLQPTATENK